MSDAEPAPPPAQQPGQPEKQASNSFGHWIGSLWLYTLLRFALFMALWGLLEFAGLHGLIAAALALVLSMPLSFIVLARPRAVVANNIERRVDAARQAREELSARLDPVPEPDD